MALGKCTITNLSRISGVKPYSSPWHQVVAKSKFNLWMLSFGLIELILSTLDCGEGIVLSVDDTTCLHKGPKVFGRAKHRDGVRSSQGTMIPLMGHKWVVISINVRIPGSQRHWALPVCVGLCKSSDFAKRAGRRHKTPTHIARLLVARIRRRFPTLRFVLVGDQGYGSHETAKTMLRVSSTLISKFFPDAVLHDPPGPKIPGTVGRAQKTKGRRLERPRDIVDAMTLDDVEDTQVTWYGGKKRTVKLVTGTGHWYRRGGGLVEVRWVFVRDVTGTHRDEYLYSTDVELTPEEIVSLYTSRWAIEVTFQECKAHLKIENTAVWSQTSVLNLVPLLFGCYSAVVLMYLRLGTHHPVTMWPGKTSITFSDMITTLRRTSWDETLFRDTPAAVGASRNYSVSKEQILNALCQTG